MNDDLYEPNNTLSAAWDYSGGEETILSFYGGSTGIQWNEDWYRIELKGGQTLKVQLKHDHAQGGDLDLELVHPRGKVLASSTGLQDLEQATFSASEDGPCYLRVFQGRGSYELMVRVD